MTSKGLEKYYGQTRRTSTTRDGKHLAYLPYDSSENEVRQK